MKRLRFRYQLMPVVNPSFIEDFILFLHERSMSRNDDNNKLYNAKKS